jgi:hypothetical protein
MPRQSRNRNKRNLEVDRDRRNRARHAYRSGLGHIRVGDDTPTRAAR